MSGLRTVNLEVSVPRNLRWTGPTPLPPEGLAATSRQMMSHRSDAFRQIVRRVVDGLCPLFGAEQSPLLFTSSGTGGMEAAIVNTLEPGARALAINGGVFGERFGSIARAYGIDVVEHKVPWGRAPDADDLQRLLRRHHPIDAVLLTHNETSTGVLARLGDLAKCVREHSDALVLVDGISSVGATPIEMDASGIDVVVTASQKALMASPGLAILSVSARAFDRARRVHTPRFYFDFLRMRDAIAEGTTTYTPAVGAVYSLEAALTHLHAEGLDRVYERHATLARMCREGAAGSGLSCLADAANASPTVTALILPEGASATDVRRRLELEHGVLVSQGRGALKERAIRVGHMGYVAASDMEGCLEALRLVVGR